MDLEMQFDVINGYDPILERTVCQEETQEAIVPDAAPDILRILDTRAQSFLTGKQARDGMVSITGLVRACVFYLPEGGEGICHLEIPVPFTCQAEGSGVSAQAVVQAFPRVCWAEARLLNPRKVLLRVDLAADIQVYHNRQTGICCGSVRDESEGIHQLLEHTCVDVISSVQEKPFTFSDTLDLPERTQLLCITGSPYCSESKLIGNKLIFKGGAALEAVVSDGGLVRTVCHNMDFSQIMEIPSAGEQCTPLVRILLTDLTMEEVARSAGGREVTLELLAQTVVLERRELFWLEDIYSTQSYMETKREHVSLQRCVDQGSRSVSVREQVETTTIVRGISCAWVDVGQVGAAGEGNQTVLQAQLQLNVVYLDDSEQLQSVHKTLTVTSEADLSAVCRCRCWCAQPGEVHASPTAGGVEVRFVLDFQCLITAEQSFRMVSSAMLGEARKQSQEREPSMILRLPGPGERLWDIAKCYATTTDEIVRANELEDHSIPYGKMLLIPKSRQ